MPETLRERCERRLAGLKAIRQPYEADWRDISRLAQPRRSRFLNEQANRNAKRGQIYDSHGIQAFRTLANGMTSGLSSDSRPWFTLSTYDEDMMEAGEVADWLAEVEKRLYAFLAQTNFYSAAKAGYAELGLFGTEACVMLDHWRMGAVCHPLTAGEYWIACSDANQPDTLYRRVPITVKQAVDLFKDAVSPRVREAYDKSRYEETVNAWHVIEPNDDWVEGKFGLAGKPWRSVWWDQDDTRKNDHSRGCLLQLKGYHEQPFWAPRWETTGSDIWGSSPGMEALADLRELQMQVKRKGEAVDWVIKPEKVTPPSLKLRNIPGNIVSASAVDKDAVLVPYQIPYQAISVIGEDAQRCREQINAASFADLFLAITNMRGVQPRNIEEIASRNEEKLTQLGPVISNVNGEKLQIGIDRAFGIMARGGMLPPAPDALMGKEVKVKFISILTQMQRAIGVGQIQETVGFVGNLAAVAPDALDNIDMDEAVREFAERKGAPANIVRSRADVEALRKSRAQQQQQQQMMENMPNVRQGADAARLLAEAAAGAPAA